VPVVAHPVLVIIRDREHRAAGLAGHAMTSISWAEADRGGADWRTAAVTCGLIA
jgi:hypothetical protein